MTRIMDAAVSTIHAINPALSPSVRFTHFPRQDLELRDLAPKSGSAAFRWFEPQRSSGRADPACMDPAAARIVASYSITIAYPVMPAFYGRRDLDDMEALIESDARQVMDALQSQAHLAEGGHESSSPVVEDTNRSDTRVWYQSITVSVTYHVAQNL
jgi:hypothetical protein